MDMLEKNLITQSKLPTPPCFPFPLSLGRMESEGEWVTDTVIYQIIYDFDIRCSFSRFLLGILEGKTEGMEEGMFVGVKDGLKNMITIGSNKIQIKTINCSRL